MKNLTLSFGLLFLRHIGLFPNFAFSVVLGEILLPKGACRPWDHFRFFGKTLLCILNYQVLPSLGFWTNQPLSSGLLFLKHIGLFPNFAFSAVFGETLLPKGAYRPWNNFQCLVKNVKLTGDLPVTSWF